MILSLIVGLALAAGALSYVMLPLLVGSAGANASEDRDDRASGGSSQGLSSGQAAGAGAIEVLREIEFDRATGKLSEADYGALKTMYTARALVEMREASPPPGAVFRPVTESGGPLALPVPTLGGSVASAAASVPGVCPACGPRPEPDARYCSHCARFLAAACAVCGASVTQPAARHCSDCGHRLAA